MKFYFETRFCEHLDSNWTVCIAGNEYDSSEVLKTCDRINYDASFDEWLQVQRDRVRQDVKEFLSGNGCLQRFNRLAERVENQEVLPFVGAGMSKPSGFMLWNEFLKEITKEDPGLVLEIERLMENGDYEGAAQHIVDRSYSGSCHGWFSLMAYTVAV